MKKIGLVLLAMAGFLAVSGCYRPSWYRANTTYGQLKSDSEWCKSETNIGSTRSEMIEQYEKCMKDKGYQLKDKSNPSSSGESTIRVEHTGPVEIDRNTKVYVAVSYSASGSVSPAYKYFHKKDCKHLSGVSIKEVAAGEAIAEGKSMCPDCFR